MTGEINCIHFRAYKWTCVNTGDCQNRKTDDVGHKYCSTRGIISIQTSINNYRNASVTRRDNGD